MSDYDLIIIGGGSAAFAAANRSNQLKKSTLMINDSNELPLGGTCVNVGCMPTKMLLHQGEQYYNAKNSPFSSFQLEGEANLVKALGEVRKLIEEFRVRNYLKVIERQDHVNLLNGRAMFLSENSVKVNGETYDANYFLIATGAKTFIPSIQGIDKVEYLTNVTALDLDHEPNSIAVIGGGPTGLEWGQIFHYFGVEVTILELSDRILPKEDPLISRELEEHLREEGMTILTNVKTKTVARKKDLTTVLFEENDEEKSVEVGEVFLSTGITPNTADLGLDSAGVETNEMGFIRINNQMETSQPHVYAAGDVTGKLPLETIAAKQGKIAMMNIFENTRESIDYKTVPRAVFTSPQVASVGITEGEYLERHGTCLCSTVKFEHSEIAMARKNAKGLMRLVLNHETQEVVGTQIVGPMAADLITLATYAIKNQMTINDIRDIAHAFPTHGEMIKKTAQSFELDLEEMSCCIE